MTFVLTRQIRPTVSVIIVAGACGVAGTPLAVLGAIGRCARDGVIFKGGIYLEKLWDVDTLVLDKTGTVTFGKAEVVDVVFMNGVSPERLVSAAALAERNSEHPIARAVVEYAESQQIPVVQPERFAYEPGQGVRAKNGIQTVLAGNSSWLRKHGVECVTSSKNSGGTHIFIAENGRALGEIVVSDRIRREAQDAIFSVSSAGT